MAKRGRKKKSNGSGAQRNGKGAGEPRINKSEMIRTIAAEQKITSPTQIRNLLAERGVKVSVPFVSTILSKARSKAGTSRRRRGSGRAKTATRNGRKHGSAGAFAGTSIELLQAAAELCKAAGGVQGARTAIDLVERLTQSVR